MMNHSENAAFKFHVRPCTEDLRDGDEKGDALEQLLSKDAELEQLLDEFNDIQDYREAVLKHLKMRAKAGLRGATDCLVLNLLDQNLTQPITSSEPYFETFVSLFFVIGCHTTQHTRVEIAIDDVAISIA